jgi:hypothetical protein
MYAKIIKTAAVSVVLACLVTACMETAPAARNTSTSTIPTATSSTSSTAAPATRAATNTPAQSAPPTFGNPSPTAGSSTSQQANAAADAAAYKEIDYKNKAKKGPSLVVIPGEIKSSNATFRQKFSANNIADFAELELSQANFQVLERASLGPLLKEISLAYNMGNPAAARKTMQAGKLQTTKWIVKFDILKTEQIASNSKGFDGRPVGSLIGILGHGRGAAAGGVAVGSIKTGDTTGVWLVGMRYKIMNANTTAQVAQGYKELKMEVGATDTSVLGFSSSARGGVGLDTMVQRLVQTAVWDIDAKHK